jgi:asparagine synthase (glutamine-hydrolysing)
MCGVLGVLSLSDNHHLNSENLKKSLRYLKYRGPDDINFIQKKNFWLGHTRLSIIDLKTGKQPITSNCKNYIISFNGEIYNYRELKKDLDYNFKTESDTEVILAGFIKEGVNFFSKLRGMFAFAIFDNVKEEVIIARDKIGIKPMIYYHDKNFFSFASEIKSLLSFLDEKKIKKDNLYEFFLRRFIPSPKTIYDNIFKLRPGQIIKVSKQNQQIKKQIIQDEFLIKNKKISINNMEKNISNALNNSVKKHMISDVPVGILLSGGFDSSLIAYLASKISKDINTFTVGIKDYKLNSDLEHSRIISKELNSKHHEIICESISKEELISVIKYFDEPFADTSILFYYLLTKSCSSKFKVFLSGDGADELFYGYNAYRNIAHTKTIYSKTIHKLILFLSNFNNKFYPLLNKISNSPEEKYSLGYYGMSKVLIESIFDTNLNHLNFPKKLSLSDLRNFDLEYNLPDYYLQKVDKISMMNSIEVRVPFLDIDVLNLSNKIQENDSINQQEGKIYLKKIFKDDLPSAIIKRPKQGFIRDWKYLFKQDLSELFQEYIDDNVLKLLNLNKNKYIKIFNSNSLINLLLQWRILVFSIWYKECFLKN